MKIKVHLILFAYHKYNSIDNFILLYNCDNKLHIPYKILDDKSDLPKDIAIQLLKECTGIDGWTTLKIEECPAVVYDSKDGRVISIPYMSILSRTNKLNEGGYLWKKISELNSLNICEYDKQTIVNTVVRAK